MPGRGRSWSFLRRATTASLSILFALVFYIALLSGGAGYNVFASAYNAGWDFFFGLSDTDTVKAYRSADVEAAIAYNKQLCLDGTCLTDVDWQCGFTTDWRGDENEWYGEFREALGDCFSAMIQVAPEEASLLKISRICGRHFMVFRPRSTERTPEDCAAAGGQWGRKAVLWDDEASLRIMAGMNMKSNVPAQE